MRRKRPRASTALFALSLALAGLTTVMLRGHLARLEAGAATPGDGMAVVVATRAVPRGTVLVEGDLRRATMPARYAPPGVLGSVEAAVGATLAADLAPGEPLTETRMVRAGPVAAQVPSGLRAMPLQVSLPGGAVVPGDRVDVLATYGAGQPYTETVATAVEVLQVHPGTDPDELGAVSTVILLVDPETVEQLAYARAFAELALSVASAETLPASPDTTDARP
jgi:Flp pilus assembly protein CpaB